MEPNQDRFEKKYIPLDELVYAPIHALAKSNIELSGSIIELLGRVGDVEDREKYEENKVKHENVINLKTINFIYERIKNDKNNMQNVEKVKLKVPLISIIPLSGLQVSDANIKFNIEVDDIIKNEDKNIFQAKISAMNVRNSDTAAKILYDVNIKNTPCPEGLLRLIDILDISQIPTVVKSNTIDESGKFISSKAQEYYNTLKNLNIKENKLNMANEKINLLIEKKKQNFNELLEKESEIQVKTYEEFIKNSEIEAKIRRLSDKKPKFLTILDLDYEIRNYMKKSEKIQNEISLIKEEIIVNEIDSIEEELYNE